MHLKIQDILWSGEEIASPFANATLLVARVGLGTMMAFAHGLGKLPPSEGLIATVGTLGLPFIFAWAAALSEFFRFLFVALGLATRLSALMVILTMLVAAFGIHCSDPFNERELSLVYSADFYVLRPWGPDATALIA